MSLKLYRAAACNFCQRSEIVLAAKGLAAEQVEIDLVKRPAWLAKASRGKVPLLESPDGDVHGSGVINEYLDERFPEPALLPAGAQRRAEARIWIVWCDAALAPHYEALLMNVRAEREEKLAAQLGATLRELEARLAQRDYRSGYWHGERLGLVDATFAPVFARFGGLDEFHGFRVASELVRVRAWREALAADPHVRATSPAPEQLSATLRGYREVMSRANA